MKGFLVSLLLLSLVSCIGAETQSYQASLTHIEKLTEFDRQTMSKLKKGISGYHENILVEGYWATSPFIEQDMYHGRYPFPIPHKQSWPGKQKFFEKLVLIEASNKVELICIRGVAPSRLESSFVGNCEFHYKDDHHTIIWTDAFNSHYVAKYNVKPSREFYDFVMNIVID